MLRNFGLICLRACHLNTSAVSKGRYVPRNKYTPRDNSGIHRRLKLIEQDEPDIEKANIDEKSLDDLEENIMQAAELSEETLREIERIAKHQRFKITERKYFKLPKEPSMLTWSEKEQMINLHRQDPEKWSPIVLAESFPASPAIIKKILKAKWRPYTKERLKEHDRKVSENWIAFHKGELEVHDPKLKAHLKKFVDRREGVRIISDEDAARVAAITLPKPKTSEFLSLVTAFKPKEEKVTELEEKRLQECVQPPKRIGEMYPTNVVDKSGGFYTLDDYRGRLSKQLDSGLPDRDQIKAIVDSGNKSNMTESSAFKYIAPSESFKSDAVVRQKQAKSRLQLVDPEEDRPDRIKIPKEQWKAGSLYKVKDCFYNDRGRFLYRVPGLKSD